VRRLTRRGLFAGGLAAAPAVALLHETVPHNGVHAALGGASQSAAAATSSSTAHDGGHGGGVSGATFRKGETVNHKANGFHPTKILRDFDYGKTRRLASGRVLREWEIYAVDKEVEIAPQIKYPAWTFNGRIPGPTLRAHEGELLRVKFANGSAHPHTMHFHGIHPAGMDGVPDIGRGVIQPGEIFTYEFDAKPFGLHLYHCHVGPLAEHIARGMYGTFIIDPRQGRAEADEMMMQLNGFNTTFDFAGNQIYAVNTVAFHYANEPIRVKRDELVRIYLVNILEFDPINSFHLHANFFDYFPTGTRLQPTEFTDTIVLGQGQRGILELRFPHPGKYMFHSHKTEFADLGWMGLFEVT
jgi:FtsP/CotA-like multicopper oxidase with cupredoxin domain